MNRDFLCCSGRYFKHNQILISAKTSCRTKRYSIPLSLSFCLHSLVKRGLHTKSSHILNSELFNAITSSEDLLTIKMVLQSTSNCPILRYSFLVAELSSIFLIRKVFQIPLWTSLADFSNFFLSHSACFLASCLLSVLLSLH